jgi:glycosyltransferase involved in cell wall biosynthesis
MRSKPTISIIIPVYNRADSVAATLRSVQVQTFHDWEAIVVDDGSLDGNLLSAVVSDMGDARFTYHRRENGGGGAARNTGIDLASAPFVAFLDSDDEFFPNKLERVLAVLRAEHEPRTVVFSQLLVDRKVGRHWIKPKRGPKPEERIDDYLTCTFGIIQTSTIAMTAEFAKDVRFQEHLPFSQDTDFAIRCFAAGARFRFIAEPLVRFNDVYDPARVSKQKSLEPLLDWSEQSRSTILSSRSYWGYRGWQCARIAGYTSVVRGLRLFAPAALRGCYSPVDTARIAAQVLLPPRTYQLIATQVVALFGKRSRSSAP